MFARLSTYEGPVEAYDEGLAHTMATVVPVVRSMPGNQGLIAMIDRATGRSFTITLWDSEESLRSTEEQANTLRQQAADAGREKVVDVAHCDVTLFELRPAVPTQRAPAPSAQPVA